MAKTEASNNNLSAKTGDEIKRFFANYPQFNYNSHENSWSEYYRMVKIFRWDRGNGEERTARSHFEKAIAGRFNQLYGADENKLDTLQLLCNKIGISPIPETIKSCKKAINKVHVNIMDFIDSERTGAPIPTFSSMKQFRAYTKKHHKIFPKKEAKNSSLLKYLLRRVY